MKTFKALIDELIRATPERRASLEEAIWSAYGVERAVLCLDMAHFTLTVRRRGVLHYLEMIRRMQRLTEPIVREQGGEVVKFEADNMMAVFLDCDAAVRAAVLANRALHAEPLPFDNMDRIGVSIGIDYGRLLHIRSADCFGDAVNRAFKLGEDLADHSEVLITPEVRTRLGDHAGVRFEERRYTVSGLPLDAYAVIYR